MLFLWSDAVLCHQNNINNITLLFSRIEMALGAARHPYKNIYVDYLFVVDIMPVDHLVLRPTGFIL